MPASTQSPAPARRKLFAMDGSRLKRAMGQEFYWVFHFVIGAATALALVWQTPVTLLPACGAGVATFVLLFAAHLWKPTAIVALVLVGVGFTATLAGVGVFLAMKLGFDQTPALAGAGLLGGGVGLWAAVAEGRDQLRAQGEAGSDAQGREGG